MDINLIVANSENGVIGKDNVLPWENSKDLKRFKEITNGNYIVMGRKTFESIGKPLLNRTNIVLSKTLKETPGIKVFKEIDDVLVWLKNQEIAFPKINLKAFIIGGEQIYKKFLEKDKIDKVYQTIIKGNYSGDAFFNFDSTKWKKESEEINETESFLIWKKKAEN